MKLLRMNLPRVPQCSAGLQAYFHGEPQHASTVLSEAWEARARALKQPLSDLLELWLDAALEALGAVLRWLRWSHRWAPKDGD